MSYYKDLSVYNYMGRKESNTFNIGWLEESNSYNKGRVSEEFLKSLFEYVKCPIYQTRGIYYNKFLDGENAAFVAHFNGFNVLLGTAEIRVIGQYADNIYAAPNLILHYIINHNYVPPKCFIDAVLYGPKPNSAEYNELVKALYVFNTDECNNLHCPICRSRRLYFAPKELNEHKQSDYIKVINYNKHKQDNLPTDMYIYHAVCMNCGRLINLKYNEIMMGN